MKMSLTVSPMKQLSQDILKPRNYAEIWDVKSDLNFFRRVKIIAHQRLQRFMFRKNLRGKNLTRDYAREA